MLEGLPHLLQLDALGRDFSHLRENVSKDCRIVFGEDDLAGHAWSVDLMRAFQHEGCEAAWEKRCAWRTSLNAQQPMGCFTM